MFLYGINLFIQFSDGSCKHAFYFVGVGIIQADRQTDVKIDRQTLKIAKRQTEKLKTGRQQCRTDRQTDVN